MRFQTRVFTLFLVMAILTSLIIAGFMYGPTKQIFMDLMRTNVLSIAATAAAMPDADSHNQIRTRADQDTPTYQKLESQLRRARDANRRRDLYIKYIYLNDYFEKMIEAVFKNVGHLNKFMGDGLMALFGALRDDDFQEEHAVQAALDMRTALKELQEKWAASESRARDALASLRIGIGINTGLAIVGNIGSKQRMEFTAIGDSINLAARLEQATRDGGVDILGSEYTYVATRSHFRFEPAGEISLKGKTESARTYTIRKLA